MLPRPEPEKAPKEVPHEIVAEPVVGWRMWKITRPESLTLTAPSLTQLADRFDRGENPFRGLLGARLTAVGVSGTWEHDRNDAVCNANNLSFAALSQSVLYGSSGTSGHSAPHQTCSCGFWAVKNEADLWDTIAAYEKGTAYAYGRVQMWGRIFEHKKGWRAQHARPYEITVVRDALAVQELRAFYGCDVQAGEERVEVSAAKKDRAEKDMAAAKAHLNYSFSQQLQRMNQGFSSSYAAYSRLALMSEPSGVKKRKGLKFT